MTRLASKHKVPEKVINSIFNNANVGEVTECWEWNKSIGSHGYGQVGWTLAGGVSVGTTAHRIAWIATNGLIPEGMTIDHLCRNKKCINPSHLRLLTNEENARGNSHTLKTHCPAKHEYSGSNLYVDPSGHRRCRKCESLRYLARKKVGA